MTRQDDLLCVHEPFGDAFYFGPERLSARYENDQEARANSGFGQSTYQTVVERLEKEGSEVRIIFPVPAVVAISSSISLHSSCFSTFLPLAT